MTKYYEIAVKAHELASELGGVEDKEYDAILKALTEAFEAGSDGERIL